MLYFDMEEHLMKIEEVCGVGPLNQKFVIVENDPNFVFENDPNFNTLRLYDIEGNVINVNSWIECANYVNGGWTNTYSSFSGDIFFLLLSVGLTISYFIGRYIFNEKLQNED